VIAEDARVLQTVNLLETNAFEEIASCSGYRTLAVRDEYEVSCLELDTLVEIARQVRAYWGPHAGGGLWRLYHNLVRDGSVEMLRPGR